MRQARLQLIVAWLLAGCGASVPPPPGPDEVALRYPEARFIRGIGYGVYSADAERPEARRRAEADARARVAEQVRSRIRSRLTVESRAGNDGDPAVEQVEQRVETDALFERGELVRVIQKATRCADGRCAALAVLSRERAAAAFTDAYEAHRPALQASLSAAEESEDDPVAFTSHYRSVQRDLPRLARLAARIEVLTHARYGPYAEDRRRADALTETARRLRDTPLSLVTAELPNGALGDAVARAFVRGFRELGLSAVPSGTCAASDTMRFGFEPDARVECRGGPLGRTCRLRLGGLLRDCERGVEVARFDFSGVPLRAAHPRDEARARRQLEAKLGSASFTDPLRQGLEAVLPLEVGQEPRAEIRR